MEGQLQFRSCGRRAEGKEGGVVTTHWLTLVVATSRCSRLGSKRMRRTSHRERVGRGVGGNRGRGGGHEGG